MTAPTKVLELVERFERNLDVYKHAGYKKARMRVEFIDPFFEALGWDVHNVQGYDEQYKDLVHEDAIKDCPLKQGGYYSYNANILKRVPIRTINFDNPADVARHDKMVALVERMLALHKKLAAATIPADKELYQRQIEATDRAIDRLVYELYGLGEEEIEIIEAST